MPEDTRTLADWQDMVEAETRLLAATPQEAWLRLVEEAGDVARVIRTNQTPKLQDGRLLASPLMSLIRFSRIMNFDLAESTWFKFPSVCPYCVQDIPEYRQ